MRIPPSAIAPLIALVVLGAATRVDAARVSSIRALHRDGQTFLTWVFNGGAGWTFDVYALDEPIVSESQLVRAEHLGAVGDSTYFDRRLSRVLGGHFHYRIEPGGMFLTSAEGLFVATPSRDGPRFYTVLARSAAFPQERTLVPGGNTLAQAVTEVVAPPKPVLQRTVTFWSYTVDVYTLWTSDRDTPFFPAMSNRASMPFDCGIVRGATHGASALLVRPHARGGHFLQASGGSGTPGEWRLALDDPLWNQDVASFFFGWHEDYDVMRNDNLPPLVGRVMDYTLRRMIHTVTWARDAFPIDRARVYAEGISMGGIGSTFLAFHRPDLIAAVMTRVSKFDFSFLGEPVPQMPFNPHGALRQVVDRLWGPASVDLPTEEGTGVYGRVNAGLLAERLESEGVPPMIAFNGRNDDVVGWAEKIGFYDAMNRHRQGGYFFWDTRDHNGSSTAAWSPMHQMKYLYRFRLDRSWPALSNCSVDHDPGAGLPLEGDSVGVINAFVEWDSTIVDRASEWGVTLRLRDLPTRWGVVAAPESCTVDVTPRRLQSLAIIDGEAYRWAVRRHSDLKVVQKGFVYPDGKHLLTVPGVKVYRDGVTLEIELANRVYISPLDGDPMGLGRPGAALEPAGGSAFAVTWPADGPGRVDLLDLSGRRVREIEHGTYRAGRGRIVVDTAGLPSGIYFVTARQHDAVIGMRRLAVVR